MRALILTADNAFALRLTGLLRGLGLSVDVLHSLSSAAARTRCELAVVDWDAVRSGPAQALPRLRGLAWRVVLLAGADVVYGPQMAEALAWGVCDVVLKTLKDPALAGRIAAQLKSRRYSAIEPRGCGLRLDKAARRVWARRGRGWKEIPALPPKEFDLLCAFLEHPGAALRRAALLERFWPGRSGDVNPETVDRHVQRLRRRLGAVGWLIVSVRGVGYRFSLGESPHDKRG
ncbi:MAG: winged-helix domain-containing protein [Elusimicrobia bacterium]|nr:winged-helix domain-containing protein [Elusimicrobiota bacterium]